MLLVEFNNCFCERFDMKVRQTVEISFNSCWVGWSGLEISDARDNKVTVSMSDEAYLKMESSIIKKCNEIREKQAEKLQAEIAKSQESEENG